MIEIKGVNALWVIACLLFASCTGNAVKDKTPVEKDSSKKVQEQSTVAVEQKPAINSESGLQIVNSSLGDLLIAGSRLKVKYSDLTAAIKKEMPGILAMINAQKKTLTGPVYTLITRMPKTPDEVTDFFVGIPVNDLKGISAEKTYTIKKNGYYRMETNASPGEGLKAHQEMIESLNRNKMEFKYPVLETYRETQNSEMVQVLSKTILYYPKNRKE